LFGTRFQNVASMADAPGEQTPLFPTPGELNPQSNSAWNVACACAGFLADAYDLFTIDLVLLILVIEYGERLISPAAESLIVSVMLAGVIVGQLTFGYIADWLGRKWAFVATAALTVCGALASACAVDSGGRFGLPQQLCLYRFWLGVGVGGEYPLSATVTAEAVTGTRAGQMMALVVSMQGFGMLLCSVVALLTLYAQVSLEATWRILLGFGALPSVFAFIMRWRMHESNIFKEAHEAELASEDGKGHLGHMLVDLQAFWRLLMGTAVSWMFMNMFQYSIGCFKSTILSDSMYTVGTSDRQEVVVNAWYSAIVSMFAIVGFGAGHLLINRVSRFAMQLYGFLGISITFFVLAVWCGSSSPPKGSILLIFLGLVFFFLNAGPNITTFIMPAEIFPTRVRAFCHGFSAASGKTGSLIGTSALPIISSSLGMSTVYWACGAASLLGGLVTYLFTPRNILDLAVLDGPSYEALEAMQVVRRAD